MGRFKDIATEIVENALRHAEDADPSTCYKCGQTTHKHIKVHVMEDPADKYMPLVSICEKCAGKWPHTAESWMDKYGEEK